MTEHSEKWWARMIVKHGSEQAVRTFMAEAQAKRKSVGGGFAALKETDPDKFKEVSSRGGKKGMESRWSKGEDERN
jgi:hypothetical protein